MIQVYLTTDDVTDQVLIKLITVNTRTIITTTSVTDSGNTYYYMYITQGIDIDKVTYNYVTTVNIHIMFYF